PLARTATGSWPPAPPRPGARSRGGTSSPPQAAPGRPGFPRVCKEMARIWKDERDRASEAAAELTAKVREISLPERTDAAKGGGELPADLLEKASAQLVSSFDEEQGGFGGAPKFPHPMDL